eukprot:3389115-Amphidinium_carterae.1
MSIASCQPASNYSPTQPLPTSDEPHEKQPLMLAVLMQEALSKLATNKTCVLLGGLHGLILPFKRDSLSSLKPQFTRSNNLK